MSLQPGPDYFAHLVNLARLHLPAPYVAATRHYLQERGYLSEILAAHLTTVIRQRYSNQLHTDLATLLPIVRQWLGAIWMRNRLWDTVSAEVWVQVLAWTAQDLELSTAASMIQGLAEAPFQTEIWQSLFHTDTSTPLLDRIETQLCKALSTQLLEALPTVEPWLWDSLTDTSALSLPLPTLTLPDELPSDTTSITLEEKEDSPTLPSTASATEAITLEHYLTRPSELYRLPWELMAQVKQRCGIPLVQILFLLAGHAMRQSHPANAAFTLSYQDLTDQLGWHPDPLQPAPPDLLQLLTHLSTLTITSIWMTESHLAQADAFQACGHPWEILQDTQGVFDWTAGRVSAPTDLRFTFRPGLWLTHLFRHGGTQAQSAWSSFGSYAFQLLQLDYCRNSFLLSLLVSLCLNVPEPGPQVRPVTFSVRNLLDATLPTSTSQALAMHLDMAEAMFKVWQQSLAALLTLGWSGPASERSAMPFYVAPCPDWLSRTPVSRKPQDWVEQWLAQPIQFQPPPHLMPRASSLTPTRERSTTAAGPLLRRLRFERLTGPEIRRARKLKRLTQAQLADQLHVHQSLIAKIEAGQRAVTDELERSLRQVLEL